MSSSASPAAPPATASPCHALRRGERCGGGEHWRVPRCAARSCTVTCGSPRDLLQALARASTCLAVPSLSGCKQVTDAGVRCGGVRLPVPHAYRHLLVRESQLCMHALSQCS